MKAVTSRKLAKLIILREHFVKKGERNRALGFGKECHSLRRKRRRTTHPRQSRRQTR